LGSKRASKLVLRSGDEIIICNNGGEICTMCII
jgi:hypothetical protein